MTARQNIRIGSRLARHRAAIDATPAPRVGELLQIARERKGVDLFRAERDTKIRLRYLASLEDSEYGQLPPLVYTKGFLRNYAIYLGLDPDDIIARWREETVVGRKHDRPTVVGPPRPLAAPRRGVAVTSGMLVALMFVVIVLGVFGWIGLQVLRYVGEVPTLSLSYPPSLVSVVEDERIILTGRTAPRAEITITTPDGQRLSAIADERGNWAREVLLAKGRNDFTIVATDPVTRRPSDPIRVIITVPLPGASPGATTGPTPAPIRLIVAQPANDMVADDGVVTVSGTTTGTRVTIEGHFLAPPPTGSPGPGQPTAAPTPTPVPATATPTSASPSATPEPSQAPFVDVTIGTAGSFSETLTLGPGEWQVVISAYRTGLSPLVETRRVTVPPPEPGAGMTLLIEVVRSNSSVRIVADGAVWPRYGDRTMRSGASVTVTAQEEVWLRASNAGALRITQDGQVLPSLARRGQAGTWIFRPGQAPQRTSETR